MPQRIITLGHSPDADDAFMFYALARERLKVGKLKFKHNLQDIETLNRRAEKEELDLTALSVHAYAYVADKYVLLPCGGSFGDKYGPIVVSKKKISSKKLADLCIAVPGERTTAFLALKLCIGDFDYKVVPFDKIFDVVSNGDADAGLIIHEGQLTFADCGLKKILDLGQWWDKETGLPLPLGVNGIKKSLGRDLMKEIGGYLKSSIEYGLDHREEALEYALEFAGDLEPVKADRFVAMYVNDFTVDMGERGRQGIAELLNRAADAGIIPHKVAAEFVW